MKNPLSFVIPAQAGIQKTLKWIPAFAGMTMIVLVLVMPAFAQETPQDPAPTTNTQELTAAEKAALVAKAETYLNNITTLKSRFALTGSNGDSEEGVFYLQRPGRMRFQYDPPNADYIVADGLLIHYWDDGVKNYSNAPIGSTLADFLLKKKIRLSGELKVTNVRRPADNKLVITLVQKKNSEAGDLRLLFTEEPMRLDKWRITDANGQVTETTLTNMETGTHLDPKLFVFQPPKGYDKEWKNR